MLATSKLGIPYADNENDPADAQAMTQAIAERVEELLLGTDADSPLAGGAVTGDIKTTIAEATDHGRWLLLDGRELTQAEVEDALDLDAGDAADLVALLGTGGSSVYGAAAVGKIKLPDSRGRVAVDAGAGAGLTARAVGASFGVETVLLAANESGVPNHGHSVSDAGHSHGVGTLTTNSTGSHSHTASTNSTGSHQHSGQTSGENANVTLSDTHSHTVTSSGSTGSGGLHQHNFAVTPRSWYVATGGSGAIQGMTNQPSWSTADVQGYANVSSPTYAQYVSLDGSHTHSVSVSSSIASKTGSISLSQSTHVHTVDTVAAGTHSHTVTVDSAGTHSHTVSGSVASATTGLSVVNHAGAGAAVAHQNLPPSIVLGRSFIRV